MVKLTCRLQTLPELQGMLVGLMLANVAQMDAHRIPGIFVSGIRYKREPTGQEDWKTALECIRDGHGDCEDIAAWRAAELRRAGEKATPVVKRIREGLIHCLVRRGNGKIEDPCRALGMKGKG